MFLGHDLSFWIAVGGAAVVRLFTAEYGETWPGRIFQGVATAFMAIFAAVTFTEPFLHLLRLPDEPYLIPAAALMALIGEGLMRLLIRLTADAKGLSELFRIWRGGK